MDRDIEYDLRTIDGVLQRVRHAVDCDKTIGLTAELLKALESMDEQYKEFCAELDEVNGEEKDTTYNNVFGPSIEFYIEADDWHKISRALRKMNKSV